MCGIAGILEKQPRSASHQLIKKMTDAIAHRGPDGEGVFVQDNVALGHRRLAIIDPTPAGHQPMQSVDGRYVLSYNGEVYNFSQLRLELEAEGARFHSDTDTEVVLQAVNFWGERALNRFNGMFAFALWDTREKELLLARDRYGVKPLYFYQDSDLFLFASEIKALQQHPRFRSNLDTEALTEYLTFQNFFTSKTLYQNVELLEPGTLLRVQRDGTVKKRQYWDFCFQEPTHKVDQREYQEELDRLFQQAVSRQLISDVEVGAYLSGGMDSGSITAIASQEIPDMKTFTVGFDLSSASGMEKGFDERQRAEHLSYCFQTEHYEMVLKAGDMQRAIPNLVHHLEEPRVGQCYPNYYAARLASKFVKVVLSGTGGDELFGGYPWRYYRVVNSCNFEDYIDQYYTFWQRLLPNRLLKTAIAPMGEKAQKVWTRDIFRDVFAKDERSICTPEEYVNHSLYLEAKTFLHGLLVVEDKISMAHSLETRVPFLDNDLVDFAMQCPVALKVANLDHVTRVDENQAPKKSQEYYKKTNDGKQLLRSVMQHYIPESVTKLEKQGFSAPDASWFKGESMDYVKEKLLSKHTRIYDLLDQEIITNLIEQHLQGKANRRLLIWSLLYLEQWCKQNSALLEKMDRQTMVTPSLVEA